MSRKPCPEDHGPYGDWDCACRSTPWHFWASMAAAVLALGVIAAIGAGALDKPQEEAKCATS